MSKADAKVQNPATGRQAKFKIQGGRGGPCVSVVMPVYNGETYLQEAVGSIFNQTFTDFEFIIIDDGSSDNSWQILSNCATEDERIVLVRNHKNIGLIKTLNKGVALAQGKYIARQDQDDVSLPERLAVQTAYLEQHQEVGLLSGTYYRFFVAQGERSLRQPPLTDTEIRWQLLFGNVLCHPSVMFRRQLFKRDEPIYHDAPYAEDYDLWTRLIQRTRAASLPMPLLIYRVHKNSMCATNRDEQMRKVAEISARQIQALLPAHSFTPAKVEILRRCYSAQSLRQSEIALCPVMFQLFHAFEQQPDVDQRIVRQLRRQWIQRILTNIPFQLWPEVFISGLFTSILHHDALALFMVGFIHRPRRIIHQIYGRKNVAT